MVQTSAYSTQDSSETYSVSEAVSLAHSIVEGLPSLQVTGEIVGWKGPNRTGHCYFSLKDDASAMEVIIWKSSFANLDDETKAALRDGLLVEAAGRFQVYERTGRLSFVISRLSIAGEGLLRQQVALLAKKLAQEGLLADENKKQVPAFCNTVAVVTSPTGAVIEDVKRTLARRNPLVKILISPCAVQGDGAAQTIIEALNRAIAATPECILIVRGGGSYEDLMCFNDEALARAIAACPIPTVTGIGHEPDTTIADMVADRRGSTPTGAAESVAPSIDVIAAKLNERHARINDKVQKLLTDAQADNTSYAQRMNQSMISKLNEERLELEGKVNNTALLRPEKLITDRYDSLNNTEERLVSALPRVFSQNRQALARWEKQLCQDISRRLLSNYTSLLERTSAQLSALSPYNVLTRGYAIVRSAEGSVVKDASQVIPHDKLEIMLTRGSLEVEVTSTHLTDKPSKGSEEAFASDS